MLRLLEAWDYLDGWALTERGATLARLYHECDLLIAEAVHEGLFDDLDPAALAGLASVFGYEHRSPGAAAGAVVPLAAACGSGTSGSRACRASCSPTRRPPGLPFTREPDPTFLAIAHAWAAGERLRGSPRGRGHHRR